PAHGRTPRRPRRDSRGVASRGAPGAGSAAARARARAARRRRSHAAGRSARAGRSRLVTGSAGRALDGHGRPDSQEHRNLPVDGLVLRVTTGGPRLGEAFEREARCDEGVEVRREGAAPVTDAAYAVRVGGAPEPFGEVAPDDAGRISV